MLTSKRVQGTYVAIEYSHKDCAEAENSNILGALQTVAAWPVPGVKWIQIQTGCTVIGYKMIILVEP